MLAEHRAVVRETESLRTYNDQLEKVVNDQRSEIVSINNQLEVLVPQAKSPRQKLIRRAFIGFCSSVVSDCCSNGVRVVNMSWGGNLSSYERALELNGVGESAEERLKLARKMFDIFDAALREAIDHRSLETEIVDATL